MNCCEYTWWDPETIEKHELIKFVNEYDAERKLLAIRGSNNFILASCWSARPYKTTDECYYFRATCDFEHEKRGIFKLFIFSMIAGKEVVKHEWDAKLSICRQSNYELIVSNTGGDEEILLDMKHREEWNCELTKRFTSKFESAKKLAEQEFDQTVDLSAAVKNIIFSYLE